APAGDDRAPVAVEAGQRPLITDGVPGDRPAARVAGVGVAAVRGDPDPAGRGLQRGNRPADDLEGALIVDGVRRGGRQAVRATAGLRDDEEAVAIDLEA